MKKLLCAGLLLLPVLLATCRGTSAGGIDPAEPLGTVPAEYTGRSNPLGEGASAAGAIVFRSNCVPCHGESGHGDGPAAQALVPQPANLAELQTRIGDDYLFWRIRTGKEGTAMVAWKDVLTVDQIWQLVSFIRTLK
jgi:mono/diheme cytochrome c family protein